MRILYIHQYFRTPKTGWGLRSWHIARHWADLGHEVFVVTAHDGPGTKTERHGNLTIRWMPIPYDQGFSKGKRIQAFRRFVIKAITACQEYLPADLVYATSTPLTIGLVALYMKARHKIPFVFEVRDLWPEAPIQLGLTKGPAYKLLLRELESEIYRHSNGLVTLSPPVHSLLSHRLRKKPVLLAPNFSDQNFFARGQESLESLPTDRIQVCYTGSFGLANDIPTLMEFILKARDRLISYHFLLAGDGQFKKWAEAFALDHQLLNVTFLGHMDTTGVREVLHQSHFAWVGFRPEPILETNSPNKFFDALASSTPVLLSANGWLRDLVIEKEIGFWIDRNNPSSAFEMIEFTFHNHKWKEMAANCASAANQFSLDRTLKEVDKILHA